MEQKKQVKRTAKLASPNKKQPKTAKEKKPRKMTLQVFNAICNELSFSDLGLRAACNKHGGSPSAFCNLVSGNEDLAKQYTRVRELQADFFADQIIEIADDSAKDTLEIETKFDVVKVENKEWVNRSKLRIDARKWAAAKARPKKYGENIKPEEEERVVQPIKTVLADGRSLDDLISELQAKL